MKNSLKDLSVVLNEKQKSLTAQDTKNIKGGAICGCDIRKPSWLLRLQISNAQ